jgi:cell division protein FtsB
MGEKGLILASAAVGAEKAGRGRYVALMLAVLLLVTAALVLFNRNGFLANRRLQIQMQETERELESRAAQLDSLEECARRLTTDSLFMETRVREVLGWGRPDEHIVRFVNPE